jgi:hypothetical protein
MKMTNPTILHIARVRELMDDAIHNLKYRSLMHDWTKLEEPEKTAFDNASVLGTVEYGTPAYDEAKASLGTALEHHYAHNKHHPEHWPDGIYGMSFFDMIEMICDWKAATERMKDGDLAKSFAINKDRFKIDDAMYDMMVRTAQELGFLPTEK